MSKEKRPLEPGDLLKKKHPDSHHEAMCPGMIYLESGIQGVIRCLVFGPFDLKIVEISINAVETMDGVKRNHIQVVNGEEGSGSD